VAGDIQSVKRSKWRKGAPRPLTPSFFAALGPHSVILSVGCRSEESLTTALRAAQLTGDAKLTNWLSVEPAGT
jgi:hypothetical protein